MILSNFFLPRPIRLKLSANLAYGIIMNEILALYSKRVVQNIRWFNNDSTGPYIFNEAHMIKQL